MSLAGLEHATGGLWPYLVLIFCGFLPTEVWRVLGVLAGRRLRIESEVFIWVRLVATAMLAGVVAKLLLTPSGALIAVPLWVRFLALAIGMAAFALTRRNIMVGLLVGEAAMIGLALLTVPAG
jgi:branched-subunit amino acid transport protein